MFLKKLHQRNYEFSVAFGDIVSLDSYYEYNHHKFLLVIKLLTSYYQQQKKITLSF